MNESYYVARGEKIDGPFSRTQIEALNQAGAFDADSLISQDKTNWEPLSQVVRARRKRSVTSLGLLAAMLVLGGLADVLGFLLFFDVSVSTPAGRVVNLGLMGDRQLGVIVGLGCVLFGILLGIFDWSQRNRQARS